MVVVGIALSYLLGLSVLFAISRKYSLAELIGYSFLIGMGLETFFLFFLDVINVKYSQGVLIALNLVVSGIIIGLNYKKLNEFKLDSDPRTFLQLKNINFPALFIGGIMIWLFYCVSVKCLFWPALERDSIGGFDKQAHVMAIEGKLNISLFYYHLDGADGNYPPLYYASMAYIYIFGGEMAKIITTLFYLSATLVFFDLVRKYIGATGAAFFTLMFMLVPEYFAHAALTLSNLPTTAYVCAGGLCTIAWVERKDPKFFWLGAILIGFVTWSRSDAIGFIAAALLIVGINFLRTKDWKRTITYGVLAVLPFILWALYTKFKLHNVASAKFAFVINPEHWEILKGYAGAYLFGKIYEYKGLGAIDGGQFYGLTFVLLFALIVINILVIAYLIYKKGEWLKAITSQTNILIMFFVSFALYCALFYFIDEKVQQAPMWSLMYSSFKRGMFYFAPLAIFYSATNYSSAWLFAKLEKFRSAGA